MTASSVVRLSGQKLISTVTNPLPRTTPRVGSTRKAGCGRTSTISNSKSTGTWGQHDVGHYLVIGRL